MDRDEKYEPPHLDLCCMQKCLCIGTPKTINFPFVTNEMRSVLYANLTTLKCSSIGTPKTINFPFVKNGKMVLGIVNYGTLRVKCL